MKYYSIGYKLNKRQHFIHVPVSELLKHDKKDAQKAAIAWLAENVRLAKYTSVGSVSAGHERPGIPLEFGQKKKAVKKSAIKKNPIAATVKREVDHAVSLFKKFRGEEPGFIDKVKLPKFGKAAMVIGNLEGVIYSTVRDGQPEKYIHKFDKKSRPLLISNHDGSQIAIIGGAYNFTEDGIVDK